MMHFNQQTESESNLLHKYMFVYKVFALCAQKIINEKKRKRNSAHTVSNRMQDDVSEKELERISLCKNKNWLTRFGSIEEKQRVENRAINWECNTRTDTHVLGLSDYAKTDMVYVRLQTNYWMTISPLRLKFINWSNTPKTKRKTITKWINSCGAKAGKQASELAVCVYMRVFLCSWFWLLLLRLLLLLLLLLYFYKCSC